MTCEGCYVVFEVCRGKKRPSWTPHAVSYVACEVCYVVFKVCRTEQGLPGLHTLSVTVMWRAKSVMWCVVCRKEQGLPGLYMLSVTVM